MPLMKLFSKVIPILIVTIAVLLAYMTLEPSWVRIRHVEVSSDKLPNNFKGYRIVFIADIHFGRYMSASKLGRIVDEINLTNPDVVIMGGDYISDSSAYAEPCFEALKNIRTKDGVHCVLGNTDHRVGAQAVREAIAQSGFHSIDNGSFWIERGKARILIAGVGDWWEDVQQTELVLHDATVKDFCILVSHNPDYFAEVHNEKVSLALAGHTHGGQVTFFGLYAPFLNVEHREYRSGMYSIGKEKLFVTTGLGVIFPPLRFFCRPEIVVFDLSN